MERGNMTSVDYISYGFIVILQKSRKPKAIIYYVHGIKRIKVVQ